MQRLWWFLLIALAACVPARQGIQRVEPVAPIEPLLFASVPGQTAVARFDPPGAGEQVELTLAAQVSNPNVFGVTLKRIAFEVLLENRPVGRGELAPDVFIGAGSQAPLRFNVVAPLNNRELVRAVAGAFTDRPLQFRLDGIVVFDSRSHEVSTRNTTLFSGETMARETVTAPRLRLEELESSVYLLRPDVPVVRVVVSANNPGSIGYFLYGRDLELSLAGRPVSVQDVAPIPVPAGQDSRFELLFYPQFGPDDAAERQAFEAALEGIPTLLEVRGDLLLDVLGVDTYRIEDGWALSGFVYSR